jgi:hypothetical protein
VFIPRLRVLDTWGHVTRLRGVNGSRHDLGPRQTKGATRGDGSEEGFRR